MRAGYRLASVLVAFVILGVTGVKLMAQSTIDSYNPNYPAQASQTEISDAEASDQSLDKTALVTIPQAFTKPVIDGVLSAGEWADAVLITPLTVVTGGTKIYMKNDACYLYIAGDLGCNPSYYGNGNSINIWVDVNQNGQWDGANDGNLALPAPGYLYPPDIAAWGYNTLSGWTTGSTGRIRYHSPWSTLGVQIPENLIKVRRINVAPNRCYIEAKIDFQNAPISLVQGVPFNMRIQTYSGYYTGGGSMQIQSQWPTISGAAYFNGPVPSELSDPMMTVVLGAGDYFDVNGVSVADNPTYGSKAFISGTTFDMEIDYTLNDPPPQTIDYRARFYGPFPSTALAATHSGSVTVNGPGPVTVTIPVTVPIGFYSVECEADDPEVCGIEPRQDINNVLILGPGQIPCSVWPGDVNVDGLVNYGDRKSLTNYIHDANLNPLYLSGYYRLPPHYPEPLAEIEYIAQAALPWNVPQGCHMDTDGNGTVNSFDMIAIKMNWMRFHLMENPKLVNIEDANNFYLSENYPNPFNPRTQLTFNAPEKSFIRLTVTDITGRTVATIFDGTSEGTHSVSFHAEGMASGLYFATIQMTGLESGASFSRTINMTLTK